MWTRFVDTSRTESLLRKTGLSRELTGIGPAIAKVMFAPLVALLHIPIDETGERQLYIATSARFPCKDSGGKEVDGVQLGDGIGVATGIDGKVGGGVYSIDYEGEGTSPRVQELMKGFIQDSTAEKVWKHFEEEFVRVTGSVTI
ncbi:hypothetical protein GGS20DRAFT_569282 [Poronia punctata]|nr:hypothetical protein GGS20DRAFT_569282 [Poronia punctata]